MAESRTESSNYTVLARRYRPSRFSDFVGQEAIVKALTSAIEQNRVAHAYVFTGSRGVGKTSMARMFAKALNCVQGPTVDPCGECDQCVAIAAGQDVDVLEIDGASNNRVDEIRELRQAVGYRPTRSRFKIYIIDEVHMVTTQAFNALLKTLEEPPPHVKFVFATTEVQKIPITILSRCQRFDFAGISVEKIHQRLREIVDAEGVQADEEALEIVARRAGGSMRDSQSLLDQLLALGSKKLTAEDAHRALGTAHEDRVRKLAGALLTGDTALALRLVESGVSEAIQLGEWVEQLLDYFRDLMVLSVDPSAVMLSMPNRLRGEMIEEAKRKTLEQLLEIMDILSACRMRMKMSPFARTLLDMTVVRVCRLDAFVNIDRALLRGPATPLPAPIIQTIESPALSVTPSAAEMESTDPSPEKKSPYANGNPKPTPTDVASAKLSNEPGRATSIDLVKPIMHDAVTPENWRFFWKHFLDRLQTEDAFLATMLQACEAVDCTERDRLEIVVSSSKFSSCKGYVDHTRARWESVSRSLTGRIISISIREGQDDRPATPSETPAELRERALKDPMVQRAEQLLGARLVSVERIEITQATGEDVEA